MGRRPKIEYENLCDECEKDFEELFGKGTYNGNQDNGWYCKACYKIVFEEDLDEKLQNNKDDESV